MAKSKHVIKVQYPKKKSDKYETDDGKRADQIVTREIKRAESVGSAAQAIFWNDTLVWRHRK